MSSFFLWLALIIAIVDWIAVAQGQRSIEYIAKPAVMVSLLAWLLGNGGWSGHILWFAVGLVFSLAGDVFLMLPREQFIAGLISFLLAHLAYLVGFNETLPPLNLASLIMTLVVALTASQLYRRIAAGLKASGQTGLNIPVLIYSIVISLMLLSALLTLVRDEWPAGASLLASGGALLFFLSDTLLAWNKFVVPLRYGRVAVMVTYHLGQILIILGVALFYLN